MAGLASAIFAWASLATNSVIQISQAMDTWRNVTIEITNYSGKYSLADPRTYTYSGYCYRPPQPTIQKNTKEVCASSKTAHTACGSVGVLTYHILNDQQGRIGDLAIMFSVPYNYNHYENMFALGIFEPRSTCNYDLFNQMYYEKGPFTRGTGTGNVNTHW